MGVTAVVTGAAGFAGGHLAEALAADGARVAAWHRPGGGEPPPAPPGVEWTAVEQLEPRQVEDALAAAAPDVVYHLAGAPHVGASWQSAGRTLEANVKGTAILLTALRHVGRAARVLVTGSAAVYRPSDRALDEDAPLGPASPYGVSKLAQEQVALHAAGHDGLDVVVVRPFNHIGPRQSPDFVAASVARQIARMETGRVEPVLHVGNLDARRDLTDVRDTVRAYIALAAKGARGAVYNVCTGRAVRIADLVGALRARARVAVEIRVDPARFRPNDVPLVLGDPARLVAATGWRPRFDPDRTLTDLLEYWRTIER